MKGAPMTRRRMLILLTFGALASAAACLVPLASAARETTYSISAIDFKFKGVPTRVAAGKVTFHLTNHGQASHDFKIAGKVTKLLSPGAKATLTVTLRKGHRYPYLCTVPGHATLGMKGSLLAK
jgi:uncharacterized cupredoxin-like copper-binding protein